MFYHQLQLYVCSMLAERCRQEFLRGNRESVQVLEVTGDAVAEVADGQTIQGAARRDKIISDR